MATAPQTIDYLLEQLSDVAGVSTRKMFGEYALYCSGKVVALVCNDRLFVKPTEPGRALAAGAPEEPPYPGAKPSLRIDADRWEDADWLCALIKASADALPTPPVKRSRKR